MPAMAMSERNIGRAETKRAAGGTMRHSPQRQDGVQLWHGSDLGPQEGAAGIYLGGNGLVLGGQAADNIGYPRAMQADVVITVTLIGAACQIKSAKHVEKIAAGGIASKRATRTICSEPTRCKADHKKPCVQRTVSFDRRIVPVRFVRTACPPQ